MTTKDEKVLCDIDIVFTGNSWTHTFHIAHDEEWGDKVFFEIAKAKRDGEKTYSLRHLHGYLIIALDRVDVINYRTEPWEKDYARTE